MLHFEGERADTLFRSRGLFCRRNLLKPDEDRVCVCVCVFEGPEHREKRSQWIKITSAILRQTDLLVGVDKTIVLYLSRATIPPN